MSVLRHRGQLIVDVRFRLPTGRSVRVQKVSPVQTQKGAERYAKQVLHALATGTYRHPRASPTVAEFQAAFLRYVGNNRKASTLKSYRDAFKKYLVPVLGDIQLRDIGHDDVEKLKAHLLDRELAPKTVNNVVAVLSAALELARKSKKVQAKPEIDWLPVPKTEEPPLSRADFERLVDAADEEWRTMMRFAVLTGLRIGELCELRWSDVDLDARWVRVRRAVYRGETDTPKHGRTREVPLHPSLVPLLAAHRRPGVALVFPTWDGKQHSPYNAPLKAMERAGRKAALGRPVGWHLLRHSWASWLGSAGVPAKTLMTLGGWSSLSMVQRYVNLSGEDLSAAIARLGDRPLAKLGAPVVEAEE